jgi:3-phosphoshikimate 1-carboxyvinyltransferase
MNEWIVHPAASPLAGAAAVPGDKSIGHRAFLLAALTDGTCELSGLSGGEDNRRTAVALEAMGATVAGLSGGRARVGGVGLAGLRAPAGPLDCGNSGTTMRLLCGLLAGRPFAATLTGDESLSRRPMRRVAEPLQRMGARISGRAGAGEGELLAPLVVEGGPLRGIDYASPVASAQVKSAVILAALQAKGASEIREPGPSRDHTERMLAGLGAPVSSPRPGVVRVEPDGWDGRLPARDFAVPGDPSSAAFLIAAALVAGTAPAGVSLAGVCVNPTRAGFLDAVRAMGARVEAEHRRDAAGEPVADLRAISGPPLAALSLAGDDVVRAIDEIPILAALAAFAAGATTIADAGELRVKESDRLATTVAMLRAFGIEAEERGEGLLVHGTPERRLAPAVVDTSGDHRIAMSAAVLALRAGGPSTIRDVGNVATSFPGFVETLGALGAVIEPR